MKRILIATLLISAIATSLWLLKNHETRLPSSVPRSAITENSVDVSAWPPSGEIKKQIKKKVLATWDWYYKSQTLFINFENFKLNLPEKTLSLCELYPNLTLILEAPEMTYDGEHPEILMGSSCTNGKMINAEFNLDFLLNPAVLNQIRNQPNDDLSTIQIRNWDREVPLKWRLKTLLFAPPSTELGEPIDLVKYEILAELGYSVAFEISAKKQ